jgi:signal transduction histidine kinase/CheY-like chemotaxis protein
MLPDYRGGIYMGIPNELFYFNYKDMSWQSLGVDNGLIASGINRIFIDYEKNIWMPCNRGVSKISSRRFSAFQQTHGLLEDEVSAVLEYEPGKFFLGHNSGFTLYDGKNFKRIPFPGKDKTSGAFSRILDIQADSRGNIWLANSWQGLAKINPRSPHEINWFSHVQGIHGQVMALWIDKNRKDNILVGTVEGVFERDFSHFKKMKTGQFPIIRVRKIYKTPDQLLYIGSMSSGIYEYTPQKNQWKNYRFPGDHQANQIFSLKKDSQGRLLVGTMAGLFFLKNAALEKFSCNGFSVDRPVYFILEDPGNRLWFGTDNGVVRWDGKTWRNYSAAQGLVGSETNRAAAIVSSGGNIWIGTNLSVSVYNEQFDTNNVYNPPPRIQFLSIELSDRFIPGKTSEPVRLDYDENTIAFHFRGISFLDEKSIRFKHKLEGLEGEWSKETYPYNQMVRYFKVPPGTYRFHLKARNSQGVWSDAVISPKIVIMPPFYQTWWFFLLVVFTVGSILYIIIRFFSQKRYAAILEERVEERTRQLEAAQQQLVQAQKMEAIGTLAGGIAHDFNNILGAILGYTELVLEDASDGTLMQKNAQHILNATQRAAQLVRQILAFSRQSKQEQKPLILAEIVGEALKLFRSSLPATIEIRQKIKSGSSMILGNPTQIHQVMMNLCANAAHAMKDTRGILEVILDEVILEAGSSPGKRDLEPGTYLRLMVNDTGYGIHPDVMPRIFEPYFTTKKTGEGTGMGLAVIHGIVKNHNGDISVYSEPGNGTSFHLFFPKIEGELEPDSQLSDKVPTGKERILLVDDEKELTDIGSQMLKRLGYEVKGVNDPVKALEAFRLEPAGFQLLISDLTMPTMTGLQLVKKIKKIKPDIPIIICSGYSASLTRKQANVMGINDFVMKPFIKSDLARVVRRVLDTKRRRDD